MGDLSPKLGGGVICALFRFQIWRIEATAKVGTCKCRVYETLWVIRSGQRTEETVRLQAAA